MSAITIHLSPDTERKLRDRAARAGTTVEGYVQHLAERAAGGGSGQEYLPSGEPKYITRPRLPVEQVMANLDELASGPVGKSLPPDFSRDDIYDDHD